MNTHISPVKAGAALGVLFGGVHVVWAVLVALGWAQPLLNFVLWAHMLVVPSLVKPFDFTAAVTLVIVTTVIGYVVGYCFALAFNRVHKSA